MDGQTNEQKGSKTQSDLVDRQAGRQADRQTDGRTDGQTDTQTHRGWGPLKKAAAASCVLQVHLAAAAAAAARAWLEGSQVHFSYLISHISYISLLVPHTVVSEVISVYIYM